MGAHSIRQYERFSKIFGESESREFINDLDIHMDEKLTNKLGNLVIKNDLFPVKDDVNVLKIDVSALKVDLNTLKVDMSALRDDMNSLKVEMHVVKEDVKLLKEDMKSVKLEIADLKEEMGSLRHEFLSFKIEIIEKLNEFKEYIHASRLEQIKWTISIWFATILLILGAYLKTVL